MDECPNLKNIALNALSEAFMNWQQDSNNFNDVKHFQTVVSLKNMINCLNILDDI